MKDVTFTLIQYDIKWEDTAANLQWLGDALAKVPTNTHVVVLPEMFATGFTMKPERVAERMDGTIVSWMKEMAMLHKKIITGSVVIEEDGKYWNRLIWMLPNGQYYTYNKRHLFSFAGEQEHYEGGDQRLIVQVNGWKICLNICYDLRFPVWLRQAPVVEERYDILLFVANWPERRSYPWKTLLKARAIENLCYVVGVNRVGSDNNDVYHSGDSAVIDPLGTVLWEQAHDVVLHTHTFKKEQLMEVRTKFNFLEDADRFVLV